MTLAAPADLVQEACDLLAALYPRLAAETPDPDCSAFAAPGVTARPPAAPVPGNAGAIYAKTGIDAAARDLEGVLLYSAGSRRPGPVRGGSDANTLAALEAIARLICKADDDLYRMVVAELEQRLDEAQKVPAIDEAERWRPVPQRPCPYCGCSALGVLLDAELQPSGRVECFGRTETGPCRAAWPGLIKLASDLDG